MREVNELTELTARYELTRYRNFIKSRIDRLNINIDKKIDQIKSQKGDELQDHARAWNKGVLFAYQQELSELETAYEIYTIKNN